MKKEYFTDNLSVGDITEMIDKMLHFERTAAQRSIKTKFLKIIPVVAAVVFMIGIVNFIGVFNIDDILNISDRANSSIVTTEPPENFANINATVTQNNETDEIPDDYIIINGKRYSTAETHLELDSSQITNTDIEQLKYMVNLQSLWIFSRTLTPGEDYYLPSNISDISPIAELTNLTELNLNGNQINDISPLAGLTKLEKLYLIGNQINDISVLAVLKNLTVLSLAGNQFNNISALAELINLTELNLNESQINDISALAGLTNLSVLYLSKNISINTPISQINDISPIAGLTNLLVLNLGGNQINDISALAGLTNLTNLALTNNQVSDISILAGFKNLTYLDLRYNPINIGQIEELRRLLPTIEIRADDLTEEDTATIIAEREAMRQSIAELPDDYISDFTSFENITINFDSADFISRNFQP